jgi:hypothetical protein
MRALRISHKSRDMRTPLGFMMSPESSQTAVPCE